MRPKEQAQRRETRRRRGMAVNCRNSAALTFRYSYEAKGAFGIAEKSGRIAADVSPWLF